MWTSESKRQMDERRRHELELAARQKAARESLAIFQQATQERQRARIVAYPAGAGLGAGIDVTEDVVSVLDRLTGTLDWGSGFFDDDELRAWFRLVDLLKIDVPESVERPEGHGQDDE